MDFETLEEIGLLLFFIGLFGSLYSIRLFDKRLKGIIDMPRKKINLQNFDSKYGDKLIIVMAISIISLFISFLIYIYLYY